MKSWMMWAKVAVALGAGVAAYFVTTSQMAAHRARQERDAWEARADSALVAAQRDSARADSAISVADSVQAQVDTVVVALEQAAPEIRERIDRVREETPLVLENHPAVVARDSIIQDLQAESDGWQSAFRAERKASEALRAALAVTRSSVDSLTAVLADRPKEDPWWRPKLGLGPSVGVTTDGRAYAGAGLNLSWEIHF